MLTLSFLLAATVSCAGTNDTAAIQSAVDAERLVVLVGDCRVQGNPGVRVGSDRALDLRQATIYQTENVGGSGTAGRNRVFETIPGASNVVFFGGRIVGSRNYVGGLQWSIGIMVDSAHDVLIDGTAIESFYTDGIRIGGNPPGSSGVTIRNARVSNSKRNAISITSGSHLRIYDSIFETSNCLSDAPNGVCSSYDLNMPMAGMDLEPNSGEVINDLVVIGCQFRGNQKAGVFLQANTSSPGEGYLFYRNTIAGNGAHGWIANQVNSVYAIANSVDGGTIGYSMGAGVRRVVFVDNVVSNTSSNGINFAGVWDPLVAWNTVNGEPVAYISIASPVKMNGVDGDVIIKPFQ